MTDTPGGIDGSVALMTGDTRANRTAALMPSLPWFTVPVDDELSCDLLYVPASRSTLTKVFMRSSQAAERALARFCSIIWK
jgi:hypothetical protein